MPNDLYACCIALFFRMRVWTDVLPCQTTSFPGKLTDVRTPEVTNQLRRQVCRLTLGLTVADCLEFSSRKWAFCLTPSGSHPQVQSRLHSITGTIYT